MLSHVSTWKNTTLIHYAPSPSGAVQLHGTLPSALLLTAQGTLCLEANVLHKGWFLISYLLLTEQWIHLFLSLFIAPDGQNSQKDFPKGLAAIQEELQEVGRRFRSVTFHNWQLFGPFYSAVLKKVLFPEAEPDSGRGSMWSSLLRTTQEDKGGTHSPTISQIMLRLVKKPSDKPIWAAQLLGSDSTSISE